VALWGEAGSADVAGAAERIAEIRAALEAYPAERIYNMDETGLFYRCIPNPAEVQAGQRRQARGTKSMEAKDRITLVLACNATGTHKIPVAIIGKAKQPLCFKPLRRPRPLPYFSQTNAWMDGDHFKSWFETVFLVAVRSRTTHPVDLVSDNCGAHGDLESDQVKFFALPPNCTSIYQPLDLGIIACLKRRYKRRLLDLVVGAFEATLSNRGPVSVASAAGAAGAARNAAAAGGRERAVDIGGASATLPTAGSTGEDAIVGDTGGTPCAAGPASASCVRRWLVRDGLWPEIDDRPPVPSSAAATAAVCAELRGAPLAVRRAVRSAERRAARVVVRRAARSSARRAARIEVRRAARNARDAAHGLGGGGAS